MKKAIAVILVIVALLVTSMVPIADADTGLEEALPENSDMLDYVIRAIADQSALIELTDDSDENRRVLTKELNEIIGRVLPDFTIDENNFEALASILAGFPASKLIASHLLPKRDNPEFSIGNLMGGMDLPQPMRDAFNITTTGEGSNSNYGEVGLVFEDTITIDSTTFKDIDHVGGMEWAGSLLNDYGNLIFRLIDADNPDILYGKDLGDNVITKDSIYSVSTALSAYIYIGINAEYDEDEDQLDMRLIFKGYGSIDQNMTLKAGSGPEEINSTAIAREILLDLNLTMLNPGSTDRTIYLGINDFDLDFYYGLGIDDDYEGTNIRTSALTTIFNGTMVRLMGTETIDYQNKLDYDQGLIDTASIGRSDKMNKVISYAKENTQFDNEVDHTPTIIAGIILAVIGAIILVAPRHIKH